MANASVTITYPIKGKSSAITRPAGGYAKSADVTASHSLTCSSHPHRIKFS